jgi:hypothetical protein
VNISRSDIRPIGGFFGLALHDVPPTSDSIWQAWIGQGRVAATLWTARAALALLIEHLQPPRVWLPAYMCREVGAVAPLAIRRFYPMDGDLSPDIGVLRRSLRKGDLVLAVDFFGWPPAPPFIDLVAERPDVVWVEDRTQCLWTEQRAWAPWLLYSPRKLVGVTDGGVLITTTDASLGGCDQERSDASFALPELMRFEDARETDNGNWYPAFKTRESRLSAEPRPLSRLTQALLERISLRPLVEARRRNFAFLAEQLAPYRAWPRSAAGLAPFGMPIVVGDAGALGAALAKERLFCSRHWPSSELAVDQADFPSEHALARRLLTLPCDHRYDENSLSRLVEAIRRLAPLAERDRATG